MLTPYLEKLILCGKAASNTFVFGASEKSVLNVPNDRYIIITDITYYSHLDAESIHFNTETDLENFMYSRACTQLKIFSDRSFNHYIFRNSFTISTQANSGHFQVLPNGCIKLDTYLIHNTDVCFNWAVGTKAGDGVVGISPAKSVGKSVPFDYGKEGDQQSRAVRLVSKVIGDSPTLISNQGTYTNLGGNTYNELTFPVDGTNAPKFLDAAFQFPLAHINYVEIFGNLTDIQATL